MLRLWKIWGRAEGPFRCRKTQQGQLDQQVPLGPSWCLPWGREATGQTPGRGGFVRLKNGKPRCLGGIRERATPSHPAARGEGARTKTKRKMMEPQRMMLLSLTPSRVKPTCSRLRATRASSRRNRASLKQIPVFKTAFPMPTTDAWVHSVTSDNPAAGGNRFWECWCAEVPQSSSQNSDKKVPTYHFYDFSVAPAQAPIFKN